MIKKAGYVGILPMLAYGLLVGFIGAYVLLTTLLHGISPTVELLIGGLLFVYTLCVSVYFALIVTGAIETFLSVLANLLDGDDNNDDEMIPLLSSLARRKDGFGEIAMRFITYIQTTQEKTHWYASILDSIPLPILVTDGQMRWTLVNKAVEEVLHRDRRDLLGKPCQNWNAQICNTRDCGVARLKKGQMRTAFQQQGQNFQVDTSYLFDLQGKPAGHIEVVQDVTSMQSVMDYQKKALSSLSNDLGRMANAELDFEPTPLEQSSQYTEDLYTDMERVRGNLIHLQQMTRNMLKAVDQNSAEVMSASTQLAQSASQAGQATSQIATTIQQVSHGASETTQSVTRAAATLQQMNDILGGVSAGINQQAQAVEAVSRVADKITRGDGLTAKVGETAQKVKEMMVQSDKIGGILDTIDEFASQTNLLALNAAIETARVDTQASILTEAILNRQMITQARLLAHILSSGGRNHPVPYWTELCAKTGIDCICITDGDGVITLSNDPALVGWRFPEDPKAQAYEFRKLLNAKDAAVCQKPQRRSADNKMYKFVGVSRADEPGIVQVAFDADSLENFHLRLGGFAVVAEEVRRLAEKSAQATKDISNIIKEMRNSIQNSTRLSDGVYHEMEAASVELAKAIATVSQVAGDTRDATARLVSESNAMMQMVEAVAAISEENSASSEEVSASTEEMSAQVQEVSASARSLQDLARQLQGAIAQYALA
ncbi:MAG TPA: methyl-accepting chemotaxis protein [Anaerolineaceae bacterium]